MTTIRERINLHLPIALQLLSTASLIVIAISAICGSKSLKELAGSHDIKSIDTIHQKHMHN